MIHMILQMMMEMIDGVETFKFHENSFSSVDSNTHHRDPNPESGSLTTLSLRKP